jgi:SpoVK/Ycf46/Vps4 family AAA+-type ATPase
VLFEMPGVEEREKIWRVQMHPALTPLAPDVDFRALAERYEVSGGDIRNAVLKAAMAAAGEPGSDSAKLLSQRHLEDGIRDVLSGKRVMNQLLARPLQGRDPSDQSSELLRLLESRLRQGPMVAAGLAMIALLIAVIALVVAVTS